MALRAGPFRAPASSKHQPASGFGCRQAREGEIMGRSKVAGGRSSKHPRRDCRMGELNSCCDDEGSTTSSENAFGTNSRNHALDDALFSFYRAEAIKSLKRNFTTFCKESNFSVERSKDVGVGRSAFQCYSLKYIAEVSRKLTTHQRGIIKSYGFGCLLFSSETDVSSDFIRWLARHVDCVSCQIISDQKVIPISALSVHNVFGLPNFGSAIVCDSIAGEEFLLSVFQLSEVPHITFFGNKIRDCLNLSDDGVFICFMVIAISCLLCPTASGCPSTEYLAVLQAPSEAKDHDFCKVVFYHSLAGISKMKSSMSHGGRPRILVWGNNSIKKFSELDRINKTVFGRRQLKQNYSSWPRQATDPSKGCSTMPDSGFQFFSSSFREKTHASFGPALPIELIDGILDVVKECFAHKHATTTTSQTELLATSVIRFLHDSPFFQNCNTRNRTENFIGICKTCPSPVKDANGLPAVNNARTNISQDDATDPKLFPIKKVKARVCRFLSKEEELALLNGKQHNHTKDKTPISEDNNNSGGRANFNVSAGLQTAKNCHGGQHVLASNMSPVSRIDLTSPFCEKDLPHNPVAKLQPTVSIPKQHIPTTILPNLNPAPKVANAATVSPDVEIVGVKQFDTRCNELAKQDDIAYKNRIKSMIQKAKGASKGVGKSQNVKMKANTAHVSQTSKVMPQDKHGGINARTGAKNPVVSRKGFFAVTEEEIRYYHVLVQLALDDSYNKICALTYQKVYCNYETLGKSFMPNGLVDNFLIPCYCRMLFEDCHPTKSGDHFFFSYIGENILKYNNIEKEEVIRASFEGAASQRCS